jgi:UDPglucose--hexose-1-phosphate uridylyltransferase
MSELRWHPLLAQWVVVASHRQDRPQMPANWCPFCPGSGRVPEDYDVHLYPNDFPAFSHDSGPFDSCAATDVFGVTGARGACDVVLYNPNHTKRPSELTRQQWRRIIDLWAARAAELARLPDVRQVMIFENTGVAIGVTMPHPHGQIYAFPFVPPLIQTEADNAREYYQRNFRCLYCDLLSRERDDGARIVASNESFTAFVPFAARFPSEVQIYANRHFVSLAKITDGERDDLASLISVVRRKYDNLYDLNGLEPKDNVLPLMMTVRLPPAKGDHPYHHFHVEFLPLQRSQKKLKYLASVETAGGTYLADTRPEERAAALREAEPAGRS